MYKLIFFLITSINVFRDLDIDIVDNGDNTVSIYYSIRDAGEYTINIKFGGQTVPGGFYTVVVSTVLLLSHEFACCISFQ